MGTTFLPLTLDGLIRPLSVVATSKINTNSFLGIRMVLLVGNYFVFPAGKSCWHLELVPCLVLVSLHKKKLIH